jgi:hypothetical protein
MPQCTPTQHNNKNDNNNNKEWPQKPKKPMAGEYREFGQETHVAKRSNRFCTELGE